MDGVERPFGGVVGAGGGEAVAEGFAHEVAQGVVVVGSPVEGVGLVVSDFFEVAVAAVDVLDGESARVSEGQNTALAVVGRGGAVGGAVDGGRGSDGAA